MKKYAFGVDIGGTTVKIGFFEMSGQLLDKWEIKTNTEDKGAHVVDEIVDSIEEALAAKGISKEEVLGVGMGVPGPVTKDGIALGSANIGWSNYSIAAHMSERIGLPARAGNDVKTATFGEMWMGGGKGYSDVFFITLGTGVGAGIIVDGRMMYGYKGASGEFGHIIVNREEKERCGCGRYGCLEQYASATGLVKLAKKRLAASEKDSALRNLENVTAKDIFDYAKEGDALADEVVDEFSKILGRALSDAACVINPEIIVIGGGVSKAGTFLLERVHKYFKEDTLFTCTDTKFALAELGNDAGIYGAVRMLLE